MVRYIVKQKDCLRELNERLREIEILLVGKKPVEEVEAIKEECLIDSLKNIDIETTKAIRTAEQIIMILRGEN